MADDEDDSEIEDGEDGGSDGPHKFAMTREELLEHCRVIVQEHLDQEIELSLRAVYYALIGQGLITADKKEGEGKPADRRRNYRRISDTLAKAKEAGDFPLEWLRDELRIPKDGDGFGATLDVDNALDEAESWMRDMPEWALKAGHWYGQPKVVLVVIEEDALAGTVQKPCEDMGVPWFVLRGYPSWTGIYSWYEKIKEMHEEWSNWDTYPEVHILYMGDHDPDGMAIPEHLRTTALRMAELEAVDLPELHWTRVALTQAQARAHGAPSMGVKRSSSRAPKYLEKYGTDAWEIEALPAKKLRELLNEAIHARFDDAVLKANRKQVKELRGELRSRMADPEWAAGILGEDEE